MGWRNDRPETVEVETSLGRMVGLRDGEVCVFRGIPFAKPPTGTLRWRMPEAAEPWAGVRDATRFAPVCPQAPAPFDSLLGGALSAQSEDCLYLNVWTPETAGTLKPVMVWIHGGAFVIGAGSQSIYDGKHLAARGVVIVTINYRLGAFGFLGLAGVSPGQAGGTGVEGLADQLMALDWIRRNIAAIGGDPDNVTVFGESAGAMSIASLLASPLSKGLFQRAIMQSGTAHVGYSAERSQRVARAFLDALGIEPENSGRLAAVPTEMLVKAQAAVVASSHGGRKQQLGRLPFQPAIGNSLLPHRPIEAIRQGAARGISLLCGTTRDEWKLFTATDPRTRLMSANGFDQRLARTAGAEALLRRIYSSGSVFERFNAFMTDRMFAVPTQRLLEAQLDFAPDYSYRFDWRSPLLGGVFGSCHALELGFVFGTHADGPASLFFGKGAAAEALARAMMDAWVGFARIGIPTCRSVGHWPAFERSGCTTMILGDGAPHIAEGPARERIEAWNDIPDKKLEP